MGVIANYDLFRMTTFGIRVLYQIRVKEPEIWHINLMCHVQLFMDILSQRRIWVLHLLALEDRTQPFAICSTFLIKNKNLQCVLTGDEKWVLHQNRKWKTQWLSRNERPIPKPKPDLRPKMSFFCVWNIKFIVYYELLEHENAVGADVYCQ